MRFYAYHGVGRQEQIVGNHFTVDLELSLEASKAIRHDNLDGTINYATVFDEVDHEMQRPSALLEHIAGRIAQRLFASHPLLEAIVLTVTKDYPPISGEISQTSFALSCTRQELTDLFA